jgi:4-hydroxybenzoate polyprenyltransferase
MPDYPAEIARLSRVNDWASLEVLVLGTLGIIYIYPGDSRIIFLFILFSAAAASFGYGINNYFDRHSDVKAGRALLYPHSLSPWTVRTLLVIFLLAASVLSYFTFNWNGFIVALGSFALAFAYSAMRLKKRGAMGVLAIPLSAYSLPFLSLFLTRPEQPLLGIGMITWLFIFGILDILIHQVSDIDNDARSGLKTLARDIGIEKARIAISAVLSVLVLLSAFLIWVDHLFVVSLLFIAMRFIQHDTALKRPTGHMIRLNGACDNRCSFCGYLKERDTIDSLKDLDSIESPVVIGGIEPVRSPIYTGVMAQLRQRGMNPETMSSGRPFADLSFTGLAVRSGLRDCLVSVYGHDDTTHDSVTGVEGSFREMRQGISNLKSSGVNVALYIVVSGKNVHALDKMLDFCKSLDPCAIHAEVIPPFFDKAPMERKLFFQTIKKLHRSKGIRMKSIFIDCPDLRKHLGLRPPAKAWRDCGDCAMVFECEGLIR